MLCGHLHVISYVSAWIWIIWLNQLLFSFHHSILHNLYLNVMSKYKYKESNYFHCNKTVCLDSELFLLWFVKLEFSLSPLLTNHCLQFLYCLLTFLCKIYLPIFSPIFWVIWIRCSRKLHYKRKKEKEKKERKEQEMSKRKRCYSKLCVALFWLSSFTEADCYIYFQAKWWQFRQWGWREQNEEKRSDEVPS